jgi:hypothetical protein
VIDKRGVLGKEKTGMTSTEAGIKNNARLEQSENAVSSIPRRCDPNSKATLCTMTTGNQFANIFHKCWNTDEYAKD